MPGEPGDVNESKCSERRRGVNESVDGGGYCFVCQVKLESRPAPAESASYSVSPVQHLSLLAYLEDDNNWKVSPETRKDFSSNHPLRVSLCEGCVSVNEQFLGVYQELRKTEMKLRSCLSIIYDKMVTAGKGRVELAALPGSVIRNDVMAKCYKNLSNMLPRVNLQRLPGCDSKDQGNDPSTFNLVAPGIKLEFEPNSDNDEGAGAPDIDNELDIGDPSEMTMTKPEPFTVEYLMFPVTPPDIETRSDYADDGGSSDPGSDGNDNLERSPSPQSDSDTDEEQEEHKPTKRKSRMKAHLKIIHSKEHAGKPQSSLNNKTLKHKCGICFEEFKTKLIFQRHYRARHHPQKYQCTLCKKLFTRRDTFSLHFRTVHEGVHFPCKLCPKTFRLKNLLAKHQRKRHPGGKPATAIPRPIPNPVNGRFKCPLCPTELKLERYYTDHYTRVHRQLSFNCDECDKVFSCRNSFSNHKRRQHRNVRFPCQGCSKSFTLKHNLNLHMRKTKCGDGMGLKPPPPEQVCHLCGKHLSGMSSLRKHLAEIHSEVRKHLCELCGKEFKNKGNLKSHVDWVHHGKKANVSSSSGHLPAS